jgi:hypothetical protein
VSTTRIRKFLEEGPEEKEAREGDARLGQVAVSCGYLTDAQLDECLHEQAASAEPLALGEILLRRKYVTSEQLLRLLAKPKAPLPPPEPLPEPKEVTPSSDVIRPPREPGHRWWDAVRIHLPKRKKPEKA